MHTVRRLFFAGAALFAAVALTQCDPAPPVPNPNPTDGGVTVDMTLLTPLINTVTPNAALNTGGATITITGANFALAATVTVGGNPCTNVKVVSSSEITCTVPAKAATCGPAAVVITNPGNRMATRSDVFAYQTSMLSLGMPNSLMMATNPRQVIAADLNGDTKLDLISANSGVGNVTVRLGAGDGTFGNAIATAIGTGTSPYAVAAGDLNNDGKIDIVTANNQNNTLGVRLGSGDGNFTTPAGAVPTTAASPVDIAIGDLNGDGKRDVVVANNASNNISVFLGNGDGTFQTGVTTSVTNNGRPTALILADFNGDQKLDFATANSMTNDVTVRLGDGNGGWGLTSNPMNLNAPADLVAADFNGDSKLDLAVVNGGAGTARVYVGSGDGTFISVATPAIGTGSNTRSIAAGDFNADGVADFVVTNSVGTVNAVIVTVSTDGNYMPQTPLPMGSQPAHVSVADFNRDGLADLVTTDQTNGAVIVRMNQCN